MIKIENEQLATYLMFKLDKLENEFTEEELNKIEELILNPIDINGEYSPINLDIITYFNNLKKISFLNLEIKNHDIEHLAKKETINNIYFEKCKFEDADQISILNIEELELINCSINDYSFLYTMTNLYALSIINGNVSIKGLNQLTNLKYLQLSYSNITELQNINLSKLTELHIDNTNIANFSILEPLNLQKLSISQNQYNVNKIYIKNLTEKNIVISNEDFTEFEEETNATL